MPAVIQPSLDCYTEISHRSALPPRCPFASVQRCPRYFLSLSLLGQAGSTKIDPDTDKERLDKWRKSDLFPATREQEPSISRGLQDSPNHFLNFCQEVLFDRFGLL